MPKIKDLTGQKFGKLLVICRADSKDKRGSAYWHCKCECGNIKIVRGSHLLSGSVLSCGCLVKEKNKQFHGKHLDSKTRLYKIWTHMKLRCNNSNDYRYSLYGARGIKVCKEWENNFLVFKKWSIENGYAENLTLDRIDNNKGYEPSNCRWADYKTQGNNRRTNVLLTLNNEQHTLTEWSEITNIPFSTLQGRIKIGWSTKDILTKPVRKYVKKPVLEGEF